MEQQRNALCTSIRRCIDHAYTLQHQTLIGYEPKNSASSQCLLEYALVVLAVVVQEQDFDPPPL